MATDAPLIARLGPTNTSKTRRAVQRVLEHESRPLRIADPPRRGRKRSRRRPRTTGNSGTE